MSTTLAVLPTEWNEVVIRGDQWSRTCKVPGDYHLAGWLVRAREGDADPFIDITQADMTITYDAGEVLQGVTGWTTATFVLTGAETQALSLTRKGRWAIRTNKASVPKTWWKGSLIVIQNAAEGAEQ